MNAPAIFDTVLRGKFNIEPMNIGSYSAKGSAA